MYCYSIEKENLQNLQWLSTHMRSQCLKKQTDRAGKQIGTHGSILVFSLTNFRS